MSNTLPGAPSRARPQTRPAPVGLVAASALLAGSGLIHLSVVRDHLHEYVPFGVFFLGVGLFQLLAGTAVLVAPGRRLLLAAAATEVLLPALWLVSRTLGLPIGPQPWEPEGIGVADVACNALELVSALVLIGLALRSPGLGAPIPEVFPDDRDAR